MGRNFPTRILIIIFFYFSIIFLLQILKSHNSDIYLILVRKSLRKRWLQRREGVACIYWDVRDIIFFVLPSYVLLVLSKTHYQPSESSELSTADSLFLKQNSAKVRKLKPCLKENIYFVIRNMFRKGRGDWLFLMGWFALIHKWFFYLYNKI